jgi:hypothetical protein
MKRYKVSRKGMGGRPSIPLELQKQYIVIRVLVESEQEAEAIKAMSADERRTRLLDKESAVTRM